MSQVTDKLYHIMLYWVHLTWVRLRHFLWSILLLLLPVHVIIKTSFGVRMWFIKKRHIKIISHIFMIMIQFPLFYHLDFYYDCFNIGILQFSHSRVCNRSVTIYWMTIHHGILLTTRYTVQWVPLTILMTRYDWVLLTILAILFQQIISLVPITVKINEIK